MVGARHAALWPAASSCPPCFSSVNVGAAFSLRRHPSWPFSAGLLGFISFIPPSWRLQTLRLQTQPSLPGAAAASPPRRRSGVWTQWRLLSRLPPHTPARPLPLSGEGGAGRNVWRVVWEEWGRARGDAAASHGLAGLACAYVARPLESPRRCCLPGKEVWLVGEGQEEAETAAAAACARGGLPRAAGRWSGPGVRSLWGKLLAVQNLTSCVWFRKRESVCVCARARTSMCRHTHTYCS